VNTDSEASLHVVVLAAGGASRFGSAKQLAQFGGRPLLQLAVANAVAVGGSAVSVVLGARAAQLTPLLRNTPATPVLNRDWEEGIGSSLRAAVRSLPGACEGLLVVLGDQPAVSVEDLRRLVTAWRVRPESIVAAAYSGIVGVPAIFPRWCFGELAALRGDLGARSVIRRHPDRLQRVPMASAALDIDSPEDLLRAARPVEATDTP
jgi:CTP:molybdopterin cytidylyltransferase MocA